MSNRFITAVAMCFTTGLCSSHALAQSADTYVAMCLGASDEAWCKANQEQFRREFPLALKGKYAAQRNVAFCLSDGCDTAVKQNPISACAWRIVILASGDSEIHDGDMMNFKSDCGRLGQPELATAIEQAKGLFKKIYKRNLPRTFGG
jgi:hypothetical protein